jgi:tetratricopeptide (TPR) repeat protein
MSVEEEFVRWMLLIIAAIALMLALATVLAADPTRPPGLLPQPMGELGKPLTPMPMRPYFPEEDPPGRVLPPAQAAHQLWMIFDSHRAGNTAEALEGWSEVRLPEHMAHWRELAIAAAYLQSGDLVRAEKALEAAQQMQPEHAVAAYFTGLLRLEQAAMATRVPDGLKRARERLVSYTPAEDKALYERAAIIELQFAIARAQEVCRDEPLIETDMAIEESVIVPRAGDLLAALGADNFAGKAHHTLFGVLIKRGELDAAEYHLGQVAQSGMDVLYGYRDLAEAYLMQERNADAVRAIGLDLQVQFPWAAQMCERMCESWK